MRRIKENLEDIQRTELLSSREDKIKRVGLWDMLLNYIRSVVDIDDTQSLSELAAIVKSLDTPF